MPESDHAKTPDSYDDVTPVMLRPVEPIVVPAMTTGADLPADRPRRPNWVVPLVLFLATCVTTFLAAGPTYTLAVMLILTAHELGHFVQARRYRVPASLPYFIPMPLSFLGTMGAVIKMEPGVADRRSLFDIAITGPLAGMVPAIFFSVVGLRLSQVINPADYADYAMFQMGEPLLFRWLSAWIHGPLPEGQEILLHPVAFAGWVGILITGLNLIPIGQLDGGHILYSLLRRRSYPITVTLLLACAATVFLVPRYRAWLIMVVLLMLMGPKHPPTADDSVPLGPGRIVLGWCTLLFIIVGFTPTPLLRTP